MRLGINLTNAMNNATTGKETTKQPIGGGKKFTEPEIQHATQKASSKAKEDTAAMRDLIGKKDPTGRDYTPETAKKKLEYDANQKAKNTPR